MYSITMYLNTCLTGSLINFFILSSMGSFVVVELGDPTAASISISVRISFIVLIDGISGVAVIAETALFS